MTYQTLKHALLHEHTVTIPAPPVAWVFRRVGESVDCRVSIIVICL